MVTENKPVAKKGSVWVKVLLFSSLAVNLLVVGIVAGAFFRGGPPGHAGARENPPLYDLGYGAYGRALSKEDRKTVVQAMSDRAPDLRANREEIRARSVKLLQALRQVPYDPTAVLEIVLQQQSSLQARQDIGRILLLEHVTEMSDAARLKYADRLERSLRRGGRRN